MLPFLNWIERQTDKIRLDDLQQRLEADPHMPCIDRLAVDLAHGLRSFLNLNLVGDPKRKFEAVECSNGAEVWRKVVGPLVSRSEERRHFLWEFVNTPKGCTDMKDMMKCIENWESDIEMYEAAEGTAPNDEQRRQKLVRLIPKIDDEKVYELLGKFKTYDDLRDHLEKKTDWLREYRNPVKGAYLTEGEGDSNQASQGGASFSVAGREEQDQQAQVQTGGNEGSEDAFQHEIMAIVRKYGRGGAGNFGRNAGRGNFGREDARKQFGKDVPTPPKTGDKAPPCGNCGADGHTAKDCPKP